MSENKELLEVKDLGITFFTDHGALPAVQEVVLVSNQEKL